MEFEITRVDCICVFDYPSVTLVYFVTKQKYMLVSKKEINLQNAKMSGSNQQKEENVGLPAIISVCVFAFNFLLAISKGPLFLFFCIKVHL